MPLLESRKCPHCGCNTWQEFISSPPPTPSHWRCRKCGGQIAVPPVSCNISQLLCRGRVQTRDLSTDVHVVAINREGAQLRFDPETTMQLQEGDRLLFNAHLQPFGELAHYLPATVSWMRGRDCGITFVRPLSVPPGDITYIIKN